MLLQLSLMRRLGRTSQLTDNHIHPEDTSALLVKHGQELFARGDFFMAFLMIMLPHKQLCWKPADIPSDSAVCASDKRGMHSGARDLGHLYIGTHCKRGKQSVCNGAEGA